MAKLEDPVLHFDAGCPDCGERQATLPLPIPGVEDDFDWRTRDYDSFRLFLMQELAHRFPARRRWTPADMEVVLVELLAAALDRLSYAQDAVHAERYLDTARRPQSVRRLLKLIGYDAVERTDPAELDALPDAPPKPDGSPETEAERLERYWRLNPAAMNQAQLDGPRLTGEQLRMVTLADHETSLKTHPLVAGARARLIWSGAWSTILISALLEDNRGIDEKLHDDAGPPSGDRPNQIPELLWREIVDFHRKQRLSLPPVSEQLTPRRILRVMIERYRMIGTEVLLEAARSAPITFTLSIRAKKGYFRSELKEALAEVFSSDQGGFFEPGRLGFGDDVFASDIIEATMKVEGVEVACLNRFKRVGAFPDRTAAGVIEIAPDEFALCMNRRSDPMQGSYRLVVNGGEIS